MINKDTDMKTLTIEEVRELAQQLPEKIPYLKMLVLFGSRATGKTHANSDWDFAALYDEEKRHTYTIDKDWGLFEVPFILGEVFHINSDIIDVVEINHCSPLIGYSIARDGKLLYEKDSEEFTKFQGKAWKIYADTAKFRKIQKESIKIWLEKIGKV